jgi:hypothetical protein
LAQRWAIAIVLLALTVSLTAPVYAHTTLGNLSGSSPLYRSSDHELNPTNAFGRAHAPGPLGYVWPGSGLNIFSGDSSNPPGYQSPYEDFEEPTQAATGTYAPEGAILTSTSDHDSVGDLIFAINFSQPSAFITNANPNPRFNYTTIAIYMPAPVFDKTGALIQDGFEPAGGINWNSGDNTNIITTITDNYGSIFVTRADRNDPFEPGSWLLFITAPNNITFTPGRQWSEWYYIRVNQLKAPHVAGRYFFKMFLDNHYPVRRQHALPSFVNSTMPMENWPVLLVKGEVDPAIISGTLRFGDPSNSTFYGLALNLPGRVRAVGTATNPTTGEPTGRAVEARGYLNASAHGHYEIEGVAPGTYDIYASENVKIRRGQSFTLDGLLKMGPQIRGEVFSKEEFGETPWPAQRPISIVIYDSNTYDTPSIVTYSPTNLTNAPFVSYVKGNTLFASTGLLPPNSPKPVAFPWEGPLGYYSFTPPTTFKDQFGLFNGVGPAQLWWVDPGGLLDPNTFLGSARTEFVFQFGKESVYGAPAKFSGMVPQVFATWTDSLNPGKYYVRAFVNGYVQSSNDGTLLIDYSFQVASIGSQNVFVPIDLQQSKTISITVHFHDTPGSLTEAPIRGPDLRRYLIAEAFARDGKPAAFNFTQVASTSTQTVVNLNGFGMAGPILPPDPRALIKYSLARYRGIYDYGLPTDTYTIRVFMRGYIQALSPAMQFDDLDQPTLTTLTIGRGVSAISLHMFRGGGINTTISSVDWQSPPVQRNWVWSNVTVSTLVYDVASQAFIDVIYFWDAQTNRWTLPKQNSNFGNLPWPGWQVSFGPGASLIVTNGSTQVDRFGPDITSSISQDQSQDQATTVFLQENFHVGFLFNSTSYRTPSFRSSLAIYPGVYALNAWTYGYVQDNVAAVGDLGNVMVTIAWLGYEADTGIRLIEGLNFTITIPFKTEGIFAGTPYNASIRIRVFDEGDTLVAATTLFSDLSQLRPLVPSSSNSGFFADGKKLLQQAIPAGTLTLGYSNLAGLFEYVEPSTGGAGVRAATLFSADHGIWGRSNHPGAYIGDWKVMVDMVNWYLPNSYYPPSPALLQGESPFFNPYNHFGPYQQKDYTTIPNAPQGGEASVEFELDLRGYVQGLVLAFDWNDAIRTTSWAAIQVRTASTTYYWYSWDGWFDGYLDPGRYNATAIEWTTQDEGHKSYNFPLTISPGQSNRAIKITMYEGWIPIPEFTSVLPIMIMTLALGIIGVRRGKRTGE